MLCLLSLPKALGWTECIDVGFDLELIPSTEVILCDGTKQHLASLPPTEKEAINIPTNTTGFRIVLIYYESGDTRYIDAKVEAPELRYVLAALLQCRVTIAFIAPL